MNRKPLPSQTQKSLEKILQTLLENPYSEIFREPVNYKELGLIDYPKIVKKPMNLLKVQKAVQKGNNTLQTTLNEIQLIWDNCKLYNVEESDIYKVAVILEKETRKMVDEFFGKEIIYGTENHSYKKLMEKDLKIGPEDKKAFLEDIRRLEDPEELGRVVDYVREFCPAAFKEVNREDCQIIVDNLDFTSFRECWEMVKVFLLEV